MEVLEVLVACEFSGRVRDAFRAKGHYAVSCDLELSDTSGLHYCGDISHLLCNKWDLLIAFPPCTYLCSSGARWWRTRQIAQRRAIYFFMALANAAVDKICVENPIGLMSTQWRKPDQIIQPWQFGHGETKATCLWLKGLPKLRPTHIVSGREARIHKMPASKDRAKKRSITFQGVADAMAEQWG